MSTGLAKKSINGKYDAESILDIWTGNAITNVRKNLINGKRCSKPCSDCNAEGTIFGKKSCWSLERSI